jgi:hypothetical protein
MAVGLPMKTTYANGDVWSSSDANDITGTINTTAAPYAAGKNKIINGDFYVNQRSFSSTTTSFAFGFDRFNISYSGGTFTYSAQTFTVGEAPVSGYEGKNFARLAITGQTTSAQYAIFEHKIESVRTLAGQTATISFWAKAASGTPKVAVELIQNFGSGGSPSSQVFTYAGQVTLSTSWARYSVTIAVPSISGKTFGTDGSDRLTLGLWVSGGSDYNSRTGSLGLQTATIDVWGFQLEQGSTATAFQTATGTIQGELAACQRYLPAIYGGTGAGGMIGNALSTNTPYFAIPFPSTARVAPTGITTSGTFNAYVGGTASTFTPVFDGGNQFSGVVRGTVTMAVKEVCTTFYTGTILFTGCEL